MVFLSHVYMKDGAPILTKRLKEEDSNWIESVGTWWKSIIRKLLNYIKLFYFTYVSTKYICSNLTCCTLFNELLQGKWILKSQMAKPEMKFATLSVLKEISAETYRC